MAIKAEGMILDNFGMGGFYKKQADGTAATGYAVVVMDGAFVPAAFTLGFTGQPVLYKYVFLDNMVKDGVYDIAGAVTPVGTEVYLSAVQGEHGLAGALEENAPVASAVSSDEDGSFSFAGITHDGSGRYIAWVRLVPDCTTVPTASFSAAATRLNVSEGVVQTVKLQFNTSHTCDQCGGSGTFGCETHGDACLTEDCGKCGGTGNVDGVTCDNCGGLGVVCSACVEEGNAGTMTQPCVSCRGSGYIGYRWSGTISGQCPADAAAVYLSSGDSLDRATLESSVVASAASVVNTDGSTTYSIEISLTTMWFVIWCVSETEGVLTALTDGSYMAGDSDPCLSGDTIITMADGSGKRLDKLEAGDVILAGSGGPTVVTKTGRGVWQPYHTLYHFDDGTVIDEIAEHRFYNVEQGFWQKLNRWNLGEHAKRLDGTHVALVKVERIKQRAECFGLWTESDDHFANGLLGGGAGANRPLLADATLEQAADMALSLSELEIEKMFYGGVL